MLQRMEGGMKVNRSSFIVRNTHSIHMATVEDIEEYLRGRTDIDSWEFHFDPFNRELDIFVDNSYQGSLTEREIGRLLPFEIEERMEEMIGEDHPKFGEEGTLFIRGK